MSQDDNLNPFIDPTAAGETINIYDEDLPFGLSEEEKPKKKQYNVGQTAIINAPMDKPIVGVAGAGTGKTTTIIARAANVLKHFKSGQLILITFTRLAAQDLRDRIAQAVDADTASRVVVGTFHSVISKVLREHALDVGLDPDYTIIDESSSKSMYRLALDNIAKDDREFILRYFGNSYKPTKRELAKAGGNENDPELVKNCLAKSKGNVDSKWMTLLVNSISHLINTATGTELRSGHFNHETIARIYQPFVGRPYFLDGDWRKEQEIPPLAQNEAFAGKIVNILYKTFLSSVRLSQTTSTVNYDQILFLGYLMGLKNEDGKSLLDETKKNTAYVIVDEYQDTNYLQDQFINSISSGNLTVVGDIDQAIYEFRGGTTKLIARRAEEALKRDPETVLNLTENYRSQEPILDIANKIIAHNQTGKATRKPLVATRVQDYQKQQLSDPSSPYKQYYDTSLIKTASGRDEANIIATRIQYLHNECGVSYNKIAILLRSRLVLPLLKKILSDKNLQIPLNDTTHYADIMDSETMTDVLDFLKILTNPKDIYAFMAILDKPKKNIGPQKLQLLRQLAAKNEMNEVEFVLSDKLIQVSEAGQKAVYQKLNDFSKVYKDIIAKDTGAIDYSAVPEDQSVLATKIKQILTSVGYLDWIDKQKTTKMRRKGDLELVYEIVSDFEFEYKKENKNFTLLDLAKDFLANSQDFVKTNDDDGVTIATVHGAKGLEWDHVILAGFDQGIFPSNKNLDAEIESERRLLYVAVTRARDSFWATQALKRLDNQEFEESVFTREMRESDYLNELESWQYQQAKSDTDKY